MFTSRVSQVASSFESDAGGLVEKLKAIVTLVLAAVLVGLVLGACSSEPSEPAASPTPSLSRLLASRDARDLLRAEVSKVCTDEEGRAITILPYELVNSARATSAGDHWEFRTVHNRITRVANVFPSGEVSGAFLEFARSLCPPRS